MTSAHIAQVRANLEAYRARLASAGIALVSSGLDDEGENSCVVDWLSEQQADDNEKKDK